LLIVKKSRAEFRGILAFAGRGRLAFLAVPFAKQPIRAGRLGSDAGADAYFRKPSGLRGKLFNYEL